MAGSDLAKYFRKAVVTAETPHPEVSAPRLGLRSDEGFGHMNFSMSWWAITEPFQMVDEHHAHDFDQFSDLCGWRPYQHDGPFSRPLLLSRV